MKHIRKYLKFYAFFVCIIFLLQSCKVYRTIPVSAEEAVNTTKFVKIKDDTKTYKFKYIKKEGEKFYGYNLIGSNTVKVLSDQIVEKNLESGLVKIELKDKQLKEIYPINKGLSTFITIAIIPAIIAAYIIAFDPDIISPGVGF
ncbi:MAG: hypothetical protein HKO92_09535 [Flavobacteriaceae bacterium]|nr:hypothetical protein [Flavobacteriaceae bacterium]